MKKMLFAALFALTIPTDIWGDEVINDQWWLNYKHESSSSSKKWWQAVRDKSARDAEYEKEWKKAEEVELTESDIEAISKFFNGFSGTQLRVYSSPKSGERWSHDLLSVCAQLTGATLDRYELVGSGCVGKETFRFSEDLDAFVLAAPSLVETTANYLLIMKGPRLLGRLLVAEKTGDEGYGVLVQSYIKDVNRDGVMDVLSIHERTCPLEDTGSCGTTYEVSFWEEGFVTSVFPSRNDLVNQFMGAKD